MMPLISCKQNKNKESVQYSSVAHGSESLSAHGLQHTRLPCPSLSQESSPTPQFKSINSLVFSFLYTPELTSIHDYWKNHGFD